MSSSSSCLWKVAFAGVVTLLLAAVSGGAQTAPCGRPRLGPEDSASEIRFVPAGAEHVRASVLRALPVMDANQKKEKDGVITAKIDMSLGGRTSSLQMPGSGTFSIEVIPVKQGAAGGDLARSTRQAGGDPAGVAASHRPRIESCSTSGNGRSEA